MLVSDPSVYRRAVAVEPDTFQPSASEWIERAGRILDELRAARPDSAGVGIGQALFAVAQGNIALAREELAAVLAEEPNLRIALAQDPDLGPLLEDPS